MEKSQIGWRVYLVVREEFERVCGNDKKQLGDAVGAAMLMFIRAGVDKQAAAQQDYYALKAESVFGGDDRRVGPSDPSLTQHRRPPDGPAADHTARGPRRGVADRKAREN